MDLNPLEKLGQEVKFASDDAANSQKTVDRAKERALANWNRPVRNVKRRIGLVVIFAALFGLLALVRPKTEPAITYSVGPRDAEGTLGAWIAAGSSSIPLRFSEGTLVTLEPGARARVTGTNAYGATMLVERGRAHAKVVHLGQTTSWLVHAGPFDVKVIGTEFDVAWDPIREVFDLRVTEGKVVVKGPLLDEGRAVSKSEILRVDMHNKSSEVRVENPDSRNADVMTAKEEVPPSEDVVQEKPKETAPELPSASSPEKPLVIPPWKKLAAAGKHREALEAAEQAGFETILATSPASVLLELADEARFAGSPTRARQALVRARELGARGRSAFLLGKLYADVDRAPADAITWFQRYLEESPTGGLAEQALGRIVELEDRLGHRAAARQAAQSYLQRYPGGAHETLARRVVEP
jgi:transmembrane sensor